MIKQYLYKEYKTYFGHILDYYWLLLIVIVTNKTVNFF